MADQYQEQVFFNVPLFKLEPIFKKWIRDVQKEVQETQKLNSPPEPDPLDDFIPKAEVRDKIASNSTLWHMEKEGRIKLYSFRGKRFYKRSELLEAFDEVKTKKAEL